MYSSRLAPISENKENIHRWNAFSIICCRYKMLIYPVSRTEGTVLLQQRYVNILACCTFSIPGQRTSNFDSASRTVAEATSHFVRGHGSQCRDAKLHSRNQAANPTLPHAPTHNLAVIINDAELPGSSKCLHYRHYLPLQRNISMEYSCSWSSVCCHRW